jgi:hypothetical protein
VVVSGNLLYRFNSDVAQVQHETAPCFGSGRLVAPGLVLTARHVLRVKHDRPENKGATEGRDEIFASNGWQIRLHRDYHGSGVSAPKWNWNNAIVVWEKPGIDIALLQVTDYTPAPTLQVAFSTIQTAAVDAAAVVGFPRAAKTEDERLIYRADEQLTEQDGRQPYRLFVSWQSSPTTGQLWRGISGAAATVYRDTLPDPLPIFGVVQQVDPDNFNPGMIQIARIDRALREEGFCTVLRRSLKFDPKIVAYSASAAKPVPRLVLPAELRERLLDILYTFDRKDEADRVNGYMAPGPVEIIVCGLPEDAHDLFAQRLRCDALAPDGAAEIELPWLDWPKGQASERLQTINKRLSEALTGKRNSDITPADIRSALKIPDTPSWVLLQIAGAEFSDDDTRALIEWRKLWHAAAENEALPPCGVIYAIEGNYRIEEGRARLPSALEKALGTLNQRTPHEIVLPECLEEMLARWPNQLETLARRRRIAKDTLPIKAAATLYQTLKNQPAWKQFRLRNLELFLSEVA